MADEQICPQCGTPFTPRSHAPVTFCGYRCSALARSEKHRGGPIPTKTCERCGVAFEKNPDWNLDHWAQRRYCSDACRRGGRLKPPRTCAYCKGRFYPSNGRKHQPYCSHECYAMSLRTERYPVDRRPRRKLEFAHRQKTALLKRASRRCKRCGAAENLECDHIIPIWNGGTNAIANGQVLCLPCHREKTNRDVNAYWTTLQSSALTTDSVRKPISNPSNPS